MLYMNSTDCSKCAIHKSRRKMKRFLIRSGADIDTLEPRHRRITVGLIAIRCEAFILIDNPSEISVCN